MKSRRSEMVDSKDFRATLVKPEKYAKSPTTILLEEIDRKLDILIKCQGKECNCELHNSSEDFEWSCPVHGHRITAYKTSEEALNHAYPRIKKS
jgi:hypothetical protein